MKKKKLIFKQMKRNLTFLGGDYMNDLQIQQYKEKVAKSLVRNGYYTSIKDAIRSIEGILKIANIQQKNDLLGRLEEVI